MTNFDYQSLSKFGSEYKTGGQKYKDTWDLLLLIEIFDFLNRTYDLSSNEQFNQVIQFLKSNGLVSIDLNNSIRFLPNLELSIRDFLKLGGSIEREKLQKYELPVLTKDFLYRLKDVYLGNTKHLLLIDGLDDVLRFSENQLIVLSGLFRSSNELNNYFLQENIPIKIIILAREDILSHITDPDFNKIKRDGGIVLKWDNKSDDLKKLVNLRFKLSGIEPKYINSQWNYIFPRKLNNTDSWTYILEHTLYKPRDILQFLAQCAKDYPNKKRLVRSEVNIVLKNYSKEYFLEEMKNELAGFIDDESIINLQRILTKIGQQDFSYNEFKETYETLLEAKDDSYYKHLLLLLFEHGYIGQTTNVKYRDNRTKKSRSKRSLKFKHKDSNLQISYDEENKFRVHRGLYKALGFDEYYWGK